MNDGESAKSHTGKLKFKQSKQERKDEYEKASEKDETKRSHHRKRKDPRKEEVASNTGGPSRHPTAIFGDDLLRAERYEARQREEIKWSAKLDELLRDDLRGGFSESRNEYAGNADDAAWEEEIMRLRGDTFDGQAQQEIPKRWQDAAKGFETRMGRGAAGLANLDEEEYAEYIRDGMYRRKHAQSIAFEEERQRKWEEAQAKKRAAREEKRQAKKRRREEEEKEQAKQALEHARKQWENHWLNLAAAPEMLSGPIPWPVYPGPEITKESISHFLFHGSERVESSRLLRKALLRYHPDRFLSSRYYLNLANENDKAAVKEAVEKVAKILSEVIDDRRA